jgi:hypothetical protein
MFKVGLDQRETRSLKTRTELDMYVITGSIQFIQRILYQRSSCRVWRLQNTVDKYVEL